MLKSSSINHRMRAFQYARTLTFLLRHNTNKMMKTRTPYLERASLKNKVDTELLSDHNVLDILFL